MAKQIHMEYETVDCLKCGGTGNIPRFGNYANGVCFDCKGAKKRPANPKARAISYAYDAAKKELSKLRMVKASDLKIGDTIKVSIFNTFYWQKILNISERENGDLVTTLQKVTYHTSKDHEFEIAWPIEKKFEVLQSLLPEKYRNLLSIVEK